MRRALGLLCLTILALAAPAARADAAVFTDFTAVSGNQATGSLSGASVALSGLEVSTVAQGSVVDGSSPAFASSVFTPPLAHADAIQIVVPTGSSGSYSISFGQPVTDPILHVGSSASRMTFAAGTSITRLSGEPNFKVDANVVEGALDSGGGPGSGLNDASGTVRVNGTFTTLPFTAQTVYSGAQGDGVVLQVGREPATPGPAQPSVWWHLDDDPAATTAVDSSGNHRDGVIENAIAGPDGRFDRRRSIAVAGTGIGVAAEPALETPTVSVVAWVRALGAPDERLLMRYGMPTNCSDPAWSLRTSENGSLRFTGHAATGDVDAVFEGADELWDGGWHGIGVAYTGQTVRLVVDGALADQQPAAFGDLQYAAANNGLELGDVECTTESAVYDMDDFRLYGGVLSDGDLAYLTSPFHVVPPALPAQPLPAQELVARYPLDGPASDPELDASGHGLHGRGAGTQVPGRFAEAFMVDDVFDGFRVPPSGLLQPQALSVLAWVKGSGPREPSRTIVGAGDGCGYAWALATASGGGLDFLMDPAYGGPRVHTAPVPPGTIWDGAWHAVAGVVREASIEVWVDGALANSTSFPKDTERSIAYRGERSRLDVGRDEACEDTRAFGGAVDEVRLYDRPLTGEEIGYLQNPDFTDPPELPVGPTPTPTPTATPTGTPTPTPTPQEEPDLALKWHLDSVTDGVTPDSSGNALDGTVTGADPLPSARFRAGLTVKGGDLASAGTFAPVGIAHAEDAKLEPAQVTLLAWVRGTDPGDRAVVATQGGGGCGVGAYGFQRESGAQVRFRVRSSSLITVASGGDGVWDGQWHALAGVYDGSTIRLYVDGLRAGPIVNAGSAIDYADSPGGFRVGSGNASCAANTQFHGDVDEVRVYDRALSADEVAYLSAGYHRVPPRLPIPAAPKNTSRPLALGIPQVGADLTCTKGGWTGAPTFTYLWERAPRSTRVDGDSAWAAIDGAEGSVYTVRPEDDGSRVRCRVIATENGVSGEAVSTSRRADASVPVKTSDPAVSGTPIAGNELTCSHGTWTGGPEESDFRYQWLHDGQPIPGATEPKYTLVLRYIFGLDPTKLPNDPTNFPGLREINPAGDGDRLVTCRVTASNEVGSSVPADTAALRSVDFEPIAKTGPTVTVDRAEHPNPLEQTATCHRGEVYFDYSDQPGYADNIQWYRSNGEFSADQTEIAGATSPNLKITADMLGRYVRCAIIPVNPKGRGPRDYNLSRAEFIPLPIGSTAGTMNTVYRHNRYYPISLLATSDEYELVAHNTFAQLQAQELAKVSDACATPQGRRNEEQPPRSQIEPNPLWVNFRIPPEDYVTNIPLLPKWQCWILNRPDFRRQVSLTPIGYVWADNYKCDPNSANVERIWQYCRSFPIAVHTVDTSTVDALPADTEEQRQVVGQLKATTPQLVLWDVDGDNRTDIACPGSSPVLRGNFDPGRFSPTATIVNPTGNPRLPQFVTVKTQFDFPDPDAAKDDKGNVIHGAERRPLQPMWCRNTIVQPPDPKLPPCTSTGEIGRVKISGNLCPMNVRAIDDDALKGLPDELQAVIKATADKINAAQRALELAQPDASTGVRRRTRLASPDDLQTAVTAINTGASLNSVGAARAAAQAGGTQLEKQINEKLSNLPNVNIDPAKASFATDQLYTAAGTLNLNGVNIDPQGKIPTLIVPSDVTTGIPDLKQKAMTVLSQDAIPSLPSPDEAAKRAEQIALQTKAEIEKEAKRRIQAEIEEGKKAALKTLKDNIDLEAIKDKLDLGPFKLAGTDAKVTLNDDQTVTLHANAKLPGLSSSAPGLPVKDVSVHVDINASPTGQLKLQGLAFDVGEAYLFGIHLKKLHVDYGNAGLNARGQITFDFLGNAGIDIKDFGISNDGSLRSLVIDYLAGSGQGVAVGPGIFLTRIGGGFKAPDPIELYANAALSMSPSVGKGCPTVGIDGSLKLHVSPWPLTAHAEGKPNLLCHPVGNAIFDVSSAGTADLTATLDLGVPKIARITGEIGGHIRTEPNRWQLDANGHADFAFLPVNPTLKGVVGSLGIAACASFEIELPWPFDDEVTLAAGAGVRFPGGVPPLNQAALIANFRAFRGCDLGSFSPIHAVRLARVAGAPMAFTLGREPIAVSLEGAGAAPRVTLISPSGKRYDYTTGAEDHGKFLDDTFGTVLPTEDRSVVMIHHPEPGTWQAEAADGSTPVVRIETAKFLPDPKVTGTLRRAGSERVLRYRVKAIPSQEVVLSEEANGGLHVLKTVKGGGAGKLRFTPTEATSTRRAIVAQVNQDGIPRRRIEIAHYASANPKVGTPRVRVRRRGSKARVTWSRATLAVRYAVTVTYADGRTKLFTTDAKHRAVTVPAVGKKDAMSARVTAFSAASRHGGTGVGKLKHFKKPRRKRGRKRA